MTHLPRSRRLGALAGIASGGLAVAIGMLAAAITSVVSPIDAVGSEVIDRAPRWVKQWAIDTFGTDDKLALRVGIVTLLALGAIGIGALATARRIAGPIGFAVFGLVGALAAVHRPGESAGAAVPSIVGALAGGLVLDLLVRPKPIEIPGRSQAPLGWDRRRFFAATGGVAVGAVAAGAIAKVIDDGRIRELRAASREPLPDLPAGSALDLPASVEVADDEPFITPNGDFYRIDTALSFPRIDPQKWKVTIGGMVDRPLSFTYDELLALPQVERVITLCCVSNEVGGDLIGNAIWRGVLLADLLEQAGVQAGAEQVFSTSADGWTSGFPVELALDGRDAMIAVGMNGETLPLEHGYPARLVVPGLYGYVSATKWLSKIELTTWDEEGYWVPRGWSREGPVKTQSRIGWPRGSTKLTAGPQRITGVAWAQHRGIAKVEVRIDEGPWMEARLGTDVSDDTWRQWVVDWDAVAGEHIITVRATDKTGETQTEERTTVAPNGASGWHRRGVRVAEA